MYNRRYVRVEPTRRYLRFSLRTFLLVTLLLSLALGTFGRLWLKAWRDSQAGGAGNPRGFAVYNEVTATVLRFMPAKPSGSLQTAAFHGKRERDLQAGLAAVIWEAAS